MNKQNTDVKSLAHTKSGTANIMWFLHQNIEERCFFKTNERKLEILLKYYVNGRG